MKKILLLTIALLSFAGAWAEEKASGIVVWMTDGNKTEVLFADVPELTYADGYVTIQTNKPSTTLSWPLETVLKLTFEEVSTSIKTTSLDILSDKMAVYDLGGKLIRSRVKSLSELPKGTYIVKDGSVTIKVVRK
jgi:hypothetical protein